MSEHTTETVERGGFDRREALKKAAVAGGIVWAAPMIASSRVSAQAGCTLKCAPAFTGPLDIVVQGAKGPCDEITNPGQTIRVFTVTSVTVRDPATTCGCGGSATASMSPTTFTLIDSLPNQGLRNVIIGTTTLTVTCLDRSGRPISTTCTANVRARFSGSCAGGGEHLLQRRGLDRVHHRVRLVTSIGSVPRRGVQPWSPWSRSSRAHLGDPSPSPGYGRGRPMANRHRRRSCATPSVALVDGSATRRTALHRRLTESRDRAPVACPIAISAHGCVESSASRRTACRGVTPRASTSVPMVRVRDLASTKRLWSCPVRHAGAD